MNGTYKFTDSFHLSAGVRYAKNDQEFRQISFGAIVPTADVPGTSDEDVVTYSLSPEWHVHRSTRCRTRVSRPATARAARTSSCLASRRRWTPTR